MTQQRLSGRYPIDFAQLLVEYGQVVGLDGVDIVRSTHIASALITRQQAKEGYTLEKHLEFQTRAWEESEALLKYLEAQVEDLKGMDAKLDRLDEANAERSQKAASQESLPNDEALVHAANNLLLMLIEHGISIPELALVLTHTASLMGHLLGSQGGELSEDEFLSRCRTAYHDVYKFIDDFGELKEAIAEVHKIMGQDKQHAH